jgi:hypothetical protein
MLIIFFHSKKSCKFIICTSLGGTNEGDASRHYFNEVFFYLIRARSHIANFCLRQWVGLLGIEREERLAMREVV